MASFLWHLNTFSIVIILLFTPSLSRKVPRLFESELTALLRNMLSPLDPAHVDFSSIHITAANARLQLVVQDSQYAGFSNLQVTSFVPPLQLISNQLELEAQMVSVAANVAKYNLTGLWQEQAVAGTGAAWLTFDDLKLKVTFNTDMFSADPPIICVQHNTFRLDLFVSSVTGSFDNLPLVNDYINFIGRMLIEEVQQKINEQSNAIEDKLNGIYC